MTPEDICLDARLSTKALVHKSFEPYMASTPTNSSDEISRFLMLSVTSDEHSQQFVRQEGNIDLNDEVTVVNAPSAAENTGHSPLLSLNNVGYLDKVESSVYNETPQPARRKFCRKRNHGQTNVTPVAHCFTAVRSRCYFGPRNYNHG